MRLPMRSVSLSLLLLALISIAAPLPAAEPDRLAKLEADLKAAAGYEFGKDAGPLERIERAANELSVDPDQHRAVEKLLLQALASANTRDAKDFLCRELRTIATAGAPVVLPLIEMLADPQLSHLARYVLEPLEDPAAGAALRSALGKTSGKIQAGILGTLGRKRSREAVPDAGRLLGSEDIEVAKAAAAALGMIGGADAVKALEEARPRAKDVMAPWIDDALLACAEGFLKKGEKGPAARIDESFLKPGTATHLRIGALHGLAAAQGDEAIQRVVAALRDPDRRLQACAIDVARSMKSPAAGKAFSEVFDSLAPDAQELLVSALPASSVVLAAKSEHEGVRAAAFEALGRIGDSSHVELLLGAAATASGRVQQAARWGLLSLEGQGVNDALEKWLAPGDAKLRVEAIRALSARPGYLAAGRLRGLTRDDDRSVRAEAIIAMGRIAGDEEIAALVDLAIKPKDPYDQVGVDRALQRAFHRNLDREKQAAPALKAFKTAQENEKPVLLGILKLAGTAQALEAVRGALSEKGPVRDAAVNALEAWPNSAPAEDLFRLAHELSDASARRSAMRSFLARADPKDPKPAYERALKSADLPRDRAMVLECLGNFASDTAAIELVEKGLADPSEPVRAAAIPAVVRIAERIRQQDPSAARSALQKALEANPDADTKKKAQDLLAELEKLEKKEGFILRWMVAGPFQVDGKDGKAIFDAVFPPEDPQAKDVAWKRLRRGVGVWDIDLAAALGNLSQCAAYVRTAVWSDEAADARLEMGSDDGIKAWLNGQPVHSKWLSRSREPGQDVHEVKLGKGWNTLLLKVVNIDGPWGFGCRVTKRDGGAIAGLKVEPK